MDIYWSIHRGWMKTSGNMMWLQTLEGTCTVRWREWCQFLLTLADNEPHNECNHSWNWVTVGKAKQNKRGVSEMGNYPLCQEQQQICLPLWCRMLPTTERGTLPACRGVASYPPLEMMKMKITKKPELTARGWATGLNSLGIPPPSKLWTAIDSIINNKRLR